MTYCRQGHQNVSGSRFCHKCGEKLISSGIYAGMILGDRYRVQSELGHGGFGRTYLAADINRFDEVCVLKEFAPQVQGNSALQKAEELFAREAGVLYQLQHPQIPRFRELFRVNFDGEGHLFLVQDYVQGETYHRLLDLRRQQGISFTEAEVTQLLLQLLPVLQYIHAIGVIHRDISPDNLIHRYSDQLPVLIDFGGVKQIAAAVSKFEQPEFEQPESAQPMSSAGVTRLGKVGYAPPEQMQTGSVFSHSDLYALAVTVLVLLTGREPYELLTGIVKWQQQISPRLATILQRMLAVQPIDRYPSTIAVLQALSTNVSASHTNSFTQPPEPDSTQATLPVGGSLPVGGLSPIAGSSGQTAPFQQSKSVAKPFGFGKLLLSLLLAAGIGMGWGSRDRWLPLFNDQPLTQPQNSPSSKPDSPNLSPEELVRKAGIRNRREALSINPQFHIALTDATFFDRYPGQRGKTLTDRTQDAEWRRRWDAIATEWLDLLEQNLSSAARQKLGRYSTADRDLWKQQVNQLSVSSRALYDLADAKFFHLFPKRQGQNFINQPIGQVWQAIAADMVQSMQTGTTLERIQFAPGTFSKQLGDTLPPGTGRTYTASLSLGQILRINLQAPEQTTLFSIYLPKPTQAEPFLLSDSTETTWSGSLPQSGVYEIVVTSTASEAIDYQISLAVDNVTSTPADPSASKSAKPQPPDPITPSPQN
jgi:serine/threonine protein kinase, bacterial